MTETIFALAADYGVPLLFCVTFLSCLALPVPSSLLMLASGGFAAAGDLSLPAVAAAAFCGAVIGDNTGYWIARGLGQRLGDWLKAHPKRAALRDRSEVFMGKWGGASVFFSCWLVAPLGPYVNYVSGLSRFSWVRFAMWGAAGEVFWVGIYVGLGYLFADNLTAISSILSNVSGFLVAVFMAFGLGLWLWRASKARERQIAQAPQA
ncbi:membrane protein DedA with SNARE-associated domain [Yoonia maricola]|uniref:Membrane protein DedA with SNARE-associated domain n=1 Tax=Yoonia maricola TaxID=420999 RepID=A0A2M8WME1_9RHOB|nr:DedA family protein [Yoonia maricola]PJI92101.1 membrane protein DedA with SNARE-associated domain [Yoonia maricola]